MNETAGSFLFRVWPYLAATVAVAGFAIRVLVTSDRLPVVRRVLPRAQRIYLGGWAWRACWALLVGAHLAGLLFPRAILSLTRTPARLYAIEAIGFAVGLAVVADLADSAFMSLLLVAAASGVLAAGLHRWGSAWGPVTVTPYAASLLHGRPAPEFVAHLPLLVRLHLFAAFAALAVFPATRLAAFPLLFAHRALGLAGSAVVAAARPAVAWVRRGPAAMLWPDREIRWVAKPRADVARKPLADRPAVVWPRPVHEGGIGTVKHGGKAV